MVDGRSGGSVDWSVGRSTSEEVPVWSRVSVVMVDGRSGGSVDRSLRRSTSEEVPVWSRDSHSRRSVVCVLPRSTKRHQRK